TGSANLNNFHEKIHDNDLPPDTPNPINRDFRVGALGVSASQPLYRLQNKVAYDQAKQQVSQADFQFSSVQQDLILRVAQAYFDVLLAEFNVDLAVSQKAAVSENLAQAKRNFEVDIATLEVDRQRAGHYPTLDLVASYSAQYGTGATNLTSPFDLRQAQIGVALNVPIYQGGFVDSRVREAIALQENARQNVEVARR